MTWGDEVFSAAVQIVLPYWSAALALMLSAGVVIGRIDSALAARHRLDALAGGFGAVASPVRLLTPQTSLDVVTGWADPAGLLWSYLAVDLILMTLLVVLLLIVRATVQRQLAEGGSQDPEAPRRAAAAQALGWSGLALGGYWVADLLETAATVGLGLWGEDVDLQGGTAPGVAMLAARAIGGVSLLKWVGLVLAVVPVLLVASSFRSLRDRALTGLGALRGNVLVGIVLVALFLALGGDIGRQIDDVFSHAAQSPWKIVLATGLATLTSWVMLRGGMRCVAAFRCTPAVSAVTAPRLRRTLVAGVVLVLLGVSAVLVPALEAGRATFLALLLVPGVALLLWTALSWPSQVRGLALHAGAPRADAPAAWVWLLAALPLLLLWLGLLRAITTTWAVNEHPPGAGMFWWAAALGVLLVVFVAINQGRDLAAGTEPGWTEVAAWLAVSGVALGVSALPFPAAVWTGLGTVGVVVWFALVSVCGLTGLTLLGDRWAVRGALAITRVRRMPVILGLVLWGLVASTIDTDGRYYDVELLDPGRASTQVSAEVAFTRWYVGEGAPSAPTYGPGDVRSLVLVASSGGGVRAAFWTQEVWDCAFGAGCSDADQADRDRMQDVFFASGVSGGAVGLALVAAHERSGQEPATTFSHDFLAPAVAALFARDLPNSLLRLPLPGHDRSAALGDAFTEVEPELARPLSWAAGHTPYLALNATSVEDGCRFTLSTLTQASPQTRCTGVLADVPSHGPGAAPVRQGNRYLCDRDGVPQEVSLATAALVSARFPFVSPTGTLRNCQGEETFVLDGGMFDNSGGSSVTNVLEAIGPRMENVNKRQTFGCVVPRLLIIDSTFAPTASTEPDARPLQTLGPGLAVGAFYGNRSDRELVAAARTVEDAARQAKDDCGAGDTLANVVTIFPVAAGGAAAPLGWTLAQSTQATMREQLPTETNCQELPGQVPAATSTGPATDSTDISPSEQGREEHLRRLCADIQAVHGWLP
ncbi:hypothetical protein [Ornithinimicrobium avium]|uniref:hypothetical protein n=1 Tax=Ornithinimicrobium avium TaxID=2283195 RepID=UPI0013B3EFE9|nr:hypothetical protein [Ornithinimicrobium avium]